MLGTLMRPSKMASVTWSNWDPLDPRWYGSVGNRSDAGIAITADRAIENATVFRGVNVMADAIASIPLVVYEQLDDEGKEKAREHPAYDLLHDRPNAWMTSYEWRHLVIVQKILYGVHHSEVRVGRSGLSLVPLNPTTTRRVDQLTDGRYVYVTRDALVKGGFGPERRLLEDEVFRLEHFSKDGQSGVGLIHVAKNALGLALAAEKHGSMFMRKGARFAGLLKAAGPLTEIQRKQNEEAWQRAWNGPDGTGGTPVLSGMEYQQVAYNHKESQWLELRVHQVEEMLRFIGVPGVLVGYADKTSTYASAEQFFLSWVTNDVRPVTTRFAQGLNKSVVTDSPRFFADFILEGLLRGDIGTRYAAHQIAIQTGFKTPNEARVEENMNKGPKELDEFQKPMNMGAPGNANAKRPQPTRPDPAPADSEDDTQAARMAALVTRNVERIVRKEIAAIAGSKGKLGAAQRFAGNTAGWRGWLTQFYTDHATTVATDLGVSASQAASYCTQQKARFAAGVPADNADIEAESVGVLTALLEST